MSNPAQHTGPSLEDRRAAVALVTAALNSDYPAQHAIMSAYRADAAPLIMALAALAWTAIACAAEDPRQWLAQASQALLEAEATEGDTP